MSNRKTQFSILNGLLAIMTVSFATCLLYERTSNSTNIEKLQRELENSQAQLKKKESDLKSALMFVSMLKANASSGQSEKHEFAQGLIEKALFDRLQSD